MRSSSRFFRVSLIGFLWLAVVLLSLGVIKTALAASEFAYSININYQLQKDGNTRVTTRYKVTNSTANRILASIKINTPVEDVTGLSATYADGSAVPITMTKRSTAAQGYNYDYQELGLKFDRWPSGRGMTQEFVVSYTTGGLIDVKGSSKSFSVPSLVDVQSDENYTVSVSVPQDYGKLYSTSILPDIDGADGDNLRYTFASANDLKRSVSLIFGETTVYKVDFAYPLKNTSSREQTFTITLPPDTSSQKIYIEKLDPAPVSTRLDADGNVLADYRVPARSTVTVHTDIAAQVRYLEYDLEKGGSKADIPADIVKAYTGSTQYWQTTDTELVKKASAAVQNSTKVADIVRSLQNLTKETLTYNNEKISYNIRQGSTKALNDPSNAVCLEYSDLLIALLRSQGIPARMPVGYAYAGSLKKSKAVADSLHSWVEAYVPGVGWMNLDPTWAEKFDMFGKSDIDHLTFAIWGRQDSLPAAVMLAGVDQNYQYEATTVTYAEDAPHDNPQGQLNVRAYAILPGVTWLKYEATAPPQVAGDEYSVSIKQGSRKNSDSLGSLAPSQRVERSRIIFGWGSTRPTEALLSQQTETESLVLAARTANVVLWPMWLSLAIIAGALLLIALKLIIRNKRAAQAADRNRSSTQTRQAAIDRALSQTTPLMKSAREINQENNDESSQPKKT